jgi:hypothetical protein
MRCGAKLRKAKRPTPPSAEPINHPSALAVTALIVGRRLKLFVSKQSTMQRYSQPSRQHDTQIFVSLGLARFEAAKRFAKPVADFYQVLMRQVNNSHGAAFDIQRALLCERSQCLGASVKWLDLLIL